MPLTREKRTSIAGENITGTRISGLLLLPHRGKISTATRAELGLISGSPVIQPTGHPPQPGKEVFTKLHNLKSGVGIKDYNKTASQFF